MSAQVTTNEAKALLDGVKAMNNDQAMRVVERGTKVYRYPIVNG